MLKTYKYRLYPTDDQRNKIDHSIGVCRLVYNLALEVKIRAYREHGIKMSSFDLFYQLVDLKKEFKWVGEVDSQALQASIKKIDIAFKNFFRGAGYPKYKSKRNCIQSFQCPNNTRKVDWVKGTITIPKISDIPAKLSRRFEGKIKNCTVSKTPTGKYYISVLVDNGIKLPAKPLIKAETTIGIDVGISSFVVSSNGLKFEPNRFLKNKLNRLKCLQRRTSRKVKGSSNRKKSNLCVAILHEKITDSRLEYIHQVTNRLIHDNQVESIVIEDLNVSGMMANHKLAQAIGDVSFGKFFEILKYKCDWYGKNLITIGRFDPSSKRCNNCGHIHKELKLSDREWICNNCTSTHDRDENAADNIRWFGLEKTIFKNNSGSGTSEEPVELSAIAGAKKQEYISGLNRYIATITTIV